MLSADSIREHIAALLRGQLSLDDFEDWIISSSWNVLQNADLEVHQLVGAIELRLAEYSAGHLDQSELHTELQALLLHGCAIPPLQSVFISIAGSSEGLITLTMAERPDYQFNVGGSSSMRSLTSPVTRTGSAKTVVRERVAIAS